MEFTKHATARVLQRGISEFVIDCLIEFGEIEYHRGCEIYRMSKKAERRIATYMGGLSDEVLKVVKNIYVVARGELIITVGRKNCHHRRNR